MNSSRPLSGWSLRAAWLALLALLPGIAAEVHLIPAPREWSGTAATFVVDDRTAILLGRPDDADDRFAADLLREDLRDLWGVTLAATAPRSILLGLPGRDSAVRDACARLGLQDGPELGEEGYVLAVTEDEIVAAANAPAGVYYAVQTLRQLLTRLPDGRVGIPGGRIRDWPALRYRGWQDDVSRGPVPTMEFLQKQIRTLAAAKLNVFSLYIEHVFDFARYPDLAPPGAAITAAQIRELVAYARRHHVAILPQLQSFGHQKQILQHPAFAVAREMPDGGSVFRPLAEETYRRLAELYAEFVPPHEMKFFHVGCDETFELGQGRSQELAARIGVDGLYLGHVERLRELLQPHGRRLMLWGDFALHYPQMIPRLPKDCVVMNWIYTVAPDYRAQLEPFRAAGLEQWVCPGLTNWTRIFPQYAIAFPNIATLVRDGTALGATGMLNTAWDEGGENLTEQTWYGFLWSADCAWFPDRINRSRFDAAYPLVLHHASAPEMIESLHLLGGLEGLLRPQRPSDTVFMEDPFGEKRSIPGGPAHPALREIVARSARTLELIAAARPRIRTHREGVEAIAIAARRWNFLARKFLLADETSAAYRSAITPPSDPARVRQVLRDGADRLRELVAELTTLQADFRTLWLSENRPYFLETILARYAQLVGALEAQVRRLEVAHARVEQRAEPPVAEEIHLGDPQRPRRILTPSAWTNPPPAKTRPAWWNPAWRYRFLVRVDAGTADRVDWPVELAVDLEAMLRDQGKSPSFTPASIRVVENGSELPSQWVPAPNLNIRQPGRGDLVWIVPGRTPAGTSRTFAVYLDPAEQPARPDPGIRTWSEPDGDAWVENARYKIRLSAAGGRATSWQLKSLANLDLTPAGAPGKSGFFDVVEYRGDAMPLECLARGPVLVRYRLKAADGFTKTLSFYAGQPWVEAALNVAPRRFWAFDPPELMAADCTTPGHFLFADGTSGLVPRTGEFSVWRPAVAWGAKFRADGLSLACLTPDDRIQHRVGPGGGKGGIGTEGREPAMRFVVFAEVVGETGSDLPAAVRRRLEDLQQTLGTRAPPAAVITPIERRP